VSAPARDAQTRQPLPKLLGLQQDGRTRHGGLIYFHVRNIKRNRGYDRNYEHIAGFI
jgi:hypothetical protein